MDININALELLATKSRARLIGQATGAIQRLLDDPLTEAEDRRRIEQAVAQLGGVEDAAREAAYSWFNRLTALRYMDAVGVSGTHMVVTPTGASSEPECLSQARVGAFDPRIDRAPAGPGADGRPGVAQRVGRLLFENRDVEAYVVLLSAYFDLWHPLIPDMFPAGDHWTNLVPPSDLLSASSVRADIVEGIAVGESGGPSVEVIGWLYQFYIAERKQQINDAKGKITSKELAPVTQLFTPHWIVRYLVENTVGAQWLRAHPDSPLRDRFDYLVAPVPGQEDQGMGIGDPKDFRVIDPACGSGHMLTYAFDILWQMYVEAGYPRRRIAAAILDNNLFGAEIDSRAVQLASFALMMKAVEHDPGFLERKLREQDRKAAAPGPGVGQPGAGRPRITHVHSVVLEDLSPAEIAQAVRGAFGSEDSERASVGLEVNRVIEDLRNADTFGSLIRVPAGTAEVFKAVARSIEEGRRDVQLGSADAQQWREAAGICRVLEDSRYTTMVANPPYRSISDIPGMKSWARRNYPQSYSDLCTMFIQRAAALVERRGAVGMITMHAWMFLKSYQKLRPWMLSAVSLENMAHLGTRAFDSIDGEVVQTTAFTLTNASAEGTHKSVFLRMTEGTSEAFKDSVFRRAARSGDDPHRYTARNSDFGRIPGSPIVYWASEGMLAAFEKGTPLAEVAQPRQGLATADNERFLRLWFEVSASRSYLTATSREEAEASGARWFPHNKGGSFRKWWGNQDYVINWENDGKEVWDFRPRSVVRNPDYYFKPCVSWSTLSSGSPSFRYFDSSSIFGHKGSAVFPSSTNQQTILIALLNSIVTTSITAATSPTMMFEVGQIATIPWIEPESFDPAPIERLIEIFRDDWDARETSWDFQRPPYLVGDSSLLEELFAAWYERSVSTAQQAQRLESENNRFWAGVYGLEDEVEIDVPLFRVSLTYNPRFAFAPPKDKERSEEEYRWLHYQRSAKELISWLIGVIMGRYSLNTPGLILVDQGSTLDDFQARVPTASFMPDADGIVPITDSLFHDNADLRLADALSALLGADSLGQNLDFLARCLAVKPVSSGADFQPPRPVVDSRAALLKYMKSGFLKDHEQAYSNRPVYWMFSSPKGGFKALMYLHRYTPDTVGHVLTEYASEVVAKLADQIQVLDRRLPDMGGSERTRALGKREKLSAQLHDVQGYIDSTLYPLSQRRIVLDLDDGVRVNRLKLAYGMREDLDDLASPALDVRPADLTWMRKEERKGNVWWSTRNSQHIRALHEEKS